MAVAGDKPFVWKESSEVNGECDTCQQLDDERVEVWNDEEEESNKWNKFKISTTYI